MTTRYVNTASTTGGNGTTNATAGANRAYKSLSEAIVAEAYDNTGNGVFEFICDGTRDVDLVTTANWTGWTTTASDSILVKANVNSESPLKWDETKYYLQENGTFSAQGTATAVFIVGAGQHVNVEKLQMGRNVSGVNSGTDRGVFWATTPAVVTLDGCFFNMVNWPNANAGGTHYCVTGSSGADINVQNCVLLGDKASSTGDHDGLSSAAADGQSYNNTYINLDVAERNGGTDFKKNNIFQGVTTEFLDATPSAGVEYNLTNNATINSSGNDQVSKTITFVGALDYNLLDATTTNNADAIGTGIGPSADAKVPVNTASDQTRAGATTDMGPVEFSSGPTIDTVTDPTVDQVESSINTTGLSGTASATLGGKALTLGGSFASEPLTFTIDIAALASEETGPDIGSVQTLAVTGDEATPTTILTTAVKAGWSVTTLAGTLNTSDGGMIKAMNDALVEASLPTKTIVVGDRMYFDAADSSAVAADSTYTGDADSFVILLGQGGSSTTVTTWTPFVVSFSPVSSTNIIRNVIRSSIKSSIIDHLLGDPI